MSHILNSSEASADALSDLLLPITPAYTGRYAAHSKAQLKGMVIPPGVLQVSKPPLPEGWLSFVQPEGQVYFEGGASFRIVTDAYVHTESTRDKVLRFAAVAAKLVEAKNISLPVSAEMYLMPSAEEDACYYYFADHASHTLFWLQEVSTDSLAMPDVTSETNLRLALEDLYWHHIEQFCAHRFDRLYLAIDELITTYLHGEVDQRTSIGSTYPYAANDCKNFVRALQLARENPHKAETVFIVARLWSNIIRIRQQTLYGDQHARLDRRQTVADIPSTAKRSFLFSAASRLLLGVPGSYAKQMEEAWSDQIVYLNVWRDFLTRSKEDWRQYLTWSLGVSIINALLLLVPGVPTSALLAGLSLACCAVTALAAAALLARHSETCVRTCDDAVPFLMQACEDTHRRSALAFGAPRAFFLYAVGLAAAQALLWLERATNAYVLGALVALVVLASAPWGRWAENLVSVCPVWRWSRDTNKTVDALEKV